MLQKQSSIMKGSYILVIELKKDKNIQTGSLGKLFFKKGYYFYVGSALNGLNQRIQRHLRQDKKLHWHIDYLLQYAKIVDVFYRVSKDREECKIGSKLGEKLPFISGFGCSDCKCLSHLFYGSKEDILFIKDSLDMERYC